jgi:hypothetical protein
MLGELADNSRSPRFDISMLSGMMEDDGLGYAHGSFIDSAFIDNLEDFNGVMITDWNLPYA